MNAENNAKNDKADAKTKKEAQKQLDAMDEIRSSRVENDDDRETRWWDSTDASPILRKEDLKILTKIFCVDVTRRDGNNNNDPTKDDYEHFLLIRDLSIGDIERKLNELEDIVYGKEDEDDLSPLQQPENDTIGMTDSPPFSLPNSPISKNYNDEDDIGFAIFEEHVGMRSDESNVTYCFDDDKSDEASLPPLPQHSSISENEFESGGESYEFFRPHEDDAKRQSDESNFSDDDLPFRDITREEVQYYLCPGDHIEYWCPLIVAGDKRGFRETRVLKVEPESIWGILTLENCEVLPDDHAVTVLSPHSLSETRSLHCPINEFDLVEGSVGNYTPPVIREAENVARIINKNAKKIRIDAESNGLQIPDDLIRNCTGSS